MSEAEFDRQQVGGSDSGESSMDGVDGPSQVVEPEPTLPRLAVTPPPAPSTGTGRGRATRSKPAKPRRVQRMFALEEELDKKLWLYAIHVGKDRSEVVNDLLRPIVASMVLYDSRDRRAARAADAEGQGGAEG